MSAIGFKLDQAKTQFFDRQVVDAADAGHRRALSKFGAFTMTRAKRSIRKRKKAAEPGNPPSSHTGRLKRNIFFYFDREANSVVIGPALLGSRSESDLENIEYGGSSSERFEVFTPAKKRKPIIRSSRTAQPQRVTYEPRPFMGPAFRDESKASLPGLWKDSIKK